MNIETVAMVATALLALASAFQIGLAAGAPWGAAAYGGRAVLSDGALPIAYRWASAVAALTLIGVIWVALASASLVGRGSVSGSALTVLLWALTAVFVLNTLGNARGHHPVERWGAGTVTAILAALCAVLAAR
ncbi:hypothetical protein NPS01_21070 [Nocardioides psychrotolerans]|nr:hypothetical protein [Nocardioides psychrotolerans]GEP38444.1 hypothetical protein NPS01_21070 [Nocardioides psychrotolerans]